MRRSSVLSLFLAIGLLTAVPAAAKPASDPAHPRVKIALAADHGLSARIVNNGHRVHLRISGHRQYAEYAVDGAVSATAVEARFGDRGEIAVEFSPTRTLETTKPPRGCVGEPWTTKAGFFSGTIRFRGERGFVKIEARRTKGTVEVTPSWACRRGAPFASASNAAAARGFEELEPEGDVATLAARAGDPRRGFAALAVRDPEEGNYTVFAAAKFEHREGMRIVRNTAAAARTATFRFDHERGTAVVSPPWPFQGSASFRRDPHGPDRWRGSLRVPLLGAGVLALTGADFTASLRRDFPSD
jgi:hypothetical protein